MGLWTASLVFRQGQWPGLARAKRGLEHQDPIGLLLAEVNGFWAFLVTLYDFLEAL